MNLIAPIFFGLTILGVLFFGIRWIIRKQIKNKKIKALLLKPFNWFGKKKVSFQRILGVILVLVFLVGLTLLKNEVIGPSSPQGFKKKKEKQNENNTEELVGEKKDPNAVEISSSIGYITLDENGCRKVLNPKGKKILWDSPHPYMYTNQLGDTIRSGENSPPGQWNRKLEFFGQPHQKILVEFL